MLSAIEQRGATAKEPRAPSRRRGNLLCRICDCLERWNLAGMEQQELLYAARHARKCTIRRAQPEDHEELQQLHDRHAGTRIPYGYSKLFRQSLEDPAIHSFICESGSGEIVACGGVSYTSVDTDDPEWEQDYHMAYLSFGIVHADHQRQGYGSSMLFARLAMLQLAEPTVIALSATQYSMPWFSSMGFEWVSAEKDRNGSVMHTGVLHITGGEIEYVRYRLWRRGVKLPKERLPATQDGTLSECASARREEELDALPEPLPEVTALLS